MFEEEDIIPPLTKEQRNLSYEDKAVEQKANRCVDFNWSRNKNETCSYFTDPNNMRSKVIYKKCVLLDGKKCERYRKGVSYGDKD